MRRRKNESQEQTRERSLRRLRFAVLDAKKTGATTREVHETVVKAAEDWRFVNG